MQCWKDLSRKAVESLPLEVFRTCPDEVIAGLV